MGYDLHITRAADWTENVGLEITAEEWLGIVGTDPELRPEPSNGPYAAAWNSADAEHKGWFDWYEGTIYTTDPDGPTVGKMVSLARLLNGKVQGDEGEAYESQRDWHGQPSST
jgi:hypothetical protein